MPSSAETRRIRRLAAVGGLLIAVLLAALIIHGSSNRYEVVAAFDDVRGLLEGGEVTAGSINVGTVEEIWLDEDGLPRVRMSIDGDFRLREGAFANLKLASNVGAVNRYVDLIQGSGDELPDGAVLERRDTDQPVDLDQAVSTLDPATREDVAAVLAGLDRGIKGRGRDLDEMLRYSTRALGETADLLAQVRLDGLALRTLVREGRRVVGALASSPEDLGETAEQLATVLRVTANRQAELGAATADLGPALHEGRLTLEQLTGVAGTLRSLVRGVRPAVEQIAPLARDVPPFIAALAPTVRESRILIRTSPALVRRVSEVIRAALPVVGRLDTILALLNPFLDHMRARAPDVVGFFTLLADATSNYDANGNLVRAVAPVIQTNRHPNLIGPSASVPGSVIRPFDRTPGSLEGEPWRRYVRSMIGGGRSPRSFIEPDEESP